MKQTVLIAIAVVIVIVVATVGYVGYNAMVNNPATSPSPTPVGSNGVDTATVRDAVMTYIATNHTDIASLTTDLTWAGGRQESGLVGSDTYIYTAGNWNVTITNPVIPDPTYTVSAVYTDTANQVTIEWQGTFKDGTVTETSYEYVVP